MANLTEQERERVTRRISQAVSRKFEEIGVIRPDLRAAVDAADDWVETNAVAFNLALPLAARQSLTAAQKARLLAEVILRRFEVT